MDFINASVIWKADGGRINSECIHLDSVEMELDVPVRVLTGPLKDETITGGIK